jgi:hypothetical protein
MYIHTYEDTITLVEKGRRWSLKSIIESMNLFKVHCIHLWTVTMKPLVQLMYAGEKEGGKAFLTLWHLNNSSFNSDQSHLLPD